RSGRDGRPGDDRRVGLKEGEAIAGRRAGRYSGRAGGRRPVGGWVPRWAMAREPLSEGGAWGIPEASALGAARVDPPPRGWAAGPGPPARLTLRDRRRPVVAGAGDRGARRGGGGTCS